MIKPVVVVLETLACSFTFEARPRELGALRCTLNPEPGAARTCTLSASLGVGIHINGMAESFVKTMKRDYVAFMPKPDAATAARNLAIAFEHCNEKHQRWPRSFGPFSEIFKWSIRGNHTAELVAGNVATYASFGV